jgi:two-component system, NtrC family, response regulator AtoC
MAQLITSAIDVRELHRLIERLETTTSSTITLSPVPTVREEADGLIIHGDIFARVVALADRLHSAKDLPCLIEGETGSGKELIARRIHHGGQPRINQPFIAINCAAISPGLFEAELFGYASGSFTGALSGGAQGKLALAAGGTLLLDELADLPNDQQAKLLRVLEDRTWYPVGSNQLQTLKARIICACNADLLDLVSKGRFREDLYYRLKVGHIRIPPLRERREDIESLATIFMQRIRRLRGRGFQRLSTEAARLLTAYHWPGNIRQLHHLLEELGMLNDGAVLDERLVRAQLQNPESPPTIIPAPKDSVMALNDQTMTLPEDGFDLDTWTKKVLAAALEKNQGSPVRTADYLGVTRKVLYTLRKRHGLFSHGDKDESS